MRIISIYLNITFAGNFGETQLEENEQDEQEGGCHFGEFYKQAPFELLNEDPYNLFKDIAIPLYTATQYRQVSFRQILGKMGAEQTKTGKSMRNFDTFLSYR